MVIHPQLHTYPHIKEETMLLHYWNPLYVIINHWWYIFTNKYELLDLNIKALYLFLRLIFYPYKDKNDYLQ